MKYWDEVLEDDDDLDIKEVEQQKDKTKEEIEEDKRRKSDVEWQRIDALWARLGH